MTVSSPMVGKMCVHLLQQSGWKSRCCCIHSSKAGWLAKKACYRPPRPFFFFLLFFSPRHSSILFLQQAPVLPGHHVMRKQAALFYSSWKTQVKTNKPRWLFVLEQKRPDPENQMPSRQAKAGDPAVSVLSSCFRKWTSNPPKQR